MTEIIYGKIRVQFVQLDVVRIEYAKRGKFCDGNTFVVPERENLGAEVVYSQEENVVCFGDYALYLPENARSLAGVRLEKNGKKIYSYKKLLNSGELPAPEKTPEAFAIADNPRIQLPAWGYSYRRKKNNGYVVQENVQDIYLFLCGKDAKALRQAFVNVMGKSELVRLATLGSWNSKWYPYSDEEAKQLILEYEKRNVPLDNMVIDTDWRAASDRGIGYDVDTKLFPDMAGFLRWAHKQGVEIMFNDHPEPVEGASSAIDPIEVKYREEKLQSLLKLGLDTWWYDRNWHTKLISPVEGVNPEAIGIHLFEEVTKHFYQKKAKSKEIYRRPVIMANVDNIANGLYKGIKSSATHRASIQWTGDIYSEPSDLTQEVESLIKGGNNGITYINADCGGHQGNPDKEGFIRWMQFGVLSPVFRPHCTLHVARYREPWNYDEETLNIVREYNNLRYRLLPVLYQSAFHNYQTGEPMFRELYYDYPTEKKAANYEEYLLGKNLLVSPIGGAPFVALKQSHYTAPVKATFFDGIEWKGTPLKQTSYQQLNFSLNREQIEPEVPMDNFSAIFETKVCFDKDVVFGVRCDDLANVWVDGEQLFEDPVAFHGAITYTVCELKAGEEHEVRVQYYQGGNEAECSLQYYEKSDLGKGVYLPQGKWLNPFNGKIYTGGKTAYVECALNETPLFIRMGALIPLAYEAHNTRKQKWNKLVYDFYPCQQASDSGYLYEDDGETTAYKYGQFRTSAYKAGYCEESNAFCVTLNGAEGSFEGERACAEREITVKYHLLSGANKVKKVTVNGKEVEAKLAKANGEIYPLHTNASAPDGDTLLVTFTADVKADSEIKFYLA